MLKGSGWRGKVKKCPLPSTGKEHLRRWLRVRNSRLHMFHRFRELLFGKGVQNIFFRESGAARLQNSVTDFFQVRSVMGVGVNDDFHAVLLGQPEMAVAEVEAIGLSVQFHGNLASGSGSEDRFNVERESVAAQ